MTYIYLVHLVEDDGLNEEDTVIRAYTNLEAAQSSVEKLKARFKKHKCDYEGVDLYISQIELEEES